MASTPQRGFHALSLIFALNSFSWRGGKLLIALAALDLGANAFLIGALAAVYSFLPMLVSIQAGRMTDRIGLKKPIMWGAICTIAAVILPIIHLNLVTLFICPMLVGVGQLLVQVATHNGVGVVSRPEDRSTNYARLQIGASIAAFVSPIMIGGAIDHLGLKTGFLLVAASAALMFLPNAWLSDGLGVRLHAKGADAKERIVDLVGHPALRRSIFISAVAMCGIELFSFYIPIYGDSIGLSATMIGAALTARAAAVFVVRVFVRVLLGRFSEMAVLIGSLFLAAAGFAVIPIFPNAPVLFAASFVLGLGFGVSAPLTQSMTFANSPEGRSGEALGLRLLVNKAMQVVIPLAFGGIGTAFGVAPVFWTNSLILILAGLAATRDLRSQNKT